MRRRLNRHMEAPWLSFTDLLSNSFIILCLVLVFSVIARVVNEKPPIVALPDSEKFRFSTGGYSVSAEFNKALKAEKIPVIKHYLRCYGVDTIEIVGHTDRQPNGGASNLDSALAKGLGLPLHSDLRAGSNVDLGFLRAMAVRNILEKQLKDEFPSLVYRVYSAGSLIDPVSSKLLIPGALDDKRKRRIEVRFTRSNDNNWRASSRCQEAL